MTCYNIAYVLSWLECHTYTFSQVSAQLEHFVNPLMTCYSIAYVLSWLEGNMYTFCQVSAQLQGGGLVLWITRVRT